MDCRRKQGSRNQGISKLTIMRGSTLQIQHTRFQNFLRFQHFTQDFKISFVISGFRRNFRTSFEISEISGFHSRFQDFYTFCQFQHLDEHERGGGGGSYSSRFVFSYSTALTARCVTAMGQVCNSHGPGVSQSR